MAEPADVTSLAAALEDTPELFVRDRLRRQLHGNGVLSVALLRGHCVGMAYLWLEPAEEPELRRFLPGVPLLTHLCVHRDFRRGRIGAALIGVTERAAARRGRAGVALAVEPDNHGARRLYQRLDYRVWSHGLVDCATDVMLFGGDVRVDRCQIMVKNFFSGVRRGAAGIVVPVPVPRTPAAS